MKIGLNARILSDPQLRGWNRYALHLIKELATLGADLYLYSNRPPHAPHAAAVGVNGIQWRIVKPGNYFWWEQVELPRLCQQDGLDFFHSPTHFGLPWLTGTKCVLTLHDAIEEQHYAKLYRKRTLKQRMTAALTWMARQRADHSVTVSDFSKRDLVQHLQIEPDRISVTHGAADQRFTRPVRQIEREHVKERYALPARYVFYVGSLEASKNVPFLLQGLAAANLPDLYSVIGGGSEADRALLSETAAPLGIEGQLHCLVQVDDQDLAALYAGAEALVYPSVYEGFGLQLAEAMAAGCPVLAARSTCFPEVLGNGGELFSPTDPAELAQLLRRLHTSGLFRNQMAMRARRRGAAFSWQNTATQTMAVYRALLSGGC